MPWTATTSTYGLNVSISLCSTFVPGSELTEAIAKRRKTLCNERRMPVQDVSSVRKGTDFVYDQGFRRGSRSLYTIIAATKSLAHSIGLSLETCPSCHVGLTTSSEERGVFDRQQYHLKPIKNRARLSRPTERRMVIRPPPGPSVRPIGRKM